MWPFPKRKPRVRPIDHYRDIWRVVETPTLFSLERVYAVWVTDDVWGAHWAEEWRVINCFKTIDECWSERRRLRLLEGLVVHLPPKDNRQ